jgi:hypothetical protein
MKTLRSTLAIYLAIDLTITVFPILRSMADENGCLVNSHPAYESGNVVHCKCNDQFTSYNGRCQYRAAVEDELQQKLLHTLTAIKYTTDAIDSERSALIYTEIRKHFQQIGVSAGLAVLTKNPVVLAPEALALSNDLGSALGEWNTCTATPDLKVECDNLHKFQRILNDAADELIKLQHE